MFPTILRHIWAVSSHVSIGFLNYSRPAQPQTQAQPQPTTYIDALETNESGRKRCAVDVTLLGTPHHLRDSEGDSEPMVASRPTDEIDSVQILK